MNADHEELSVERLTILLLACPAEKLQKSHIWWDTSGIGSTAGAWHMQYWYWGYLLTPSVGKTVIHMHVSINFAKQTYRTFESATAHCMHTHTPQLQLQFADDIFAQHCTAVERVNTRKSLQLSKVNISWVPITGSPVCKLFAVHALTTAPTTTTASLRSHHSKVHWQRLNEQAILQVPAGYSCVCVCVA